MLCARSFTHSLPCPGLLNCSRRLTCRLTRHSLSSSPIRMSGQVIEHVVLFNVKDKTDPAKINAMIDGLSGLKSLDMVLHLTAGPIYRQRSSGLNFNHLLHSRYRTKDDLRNYSDHPNHLSVVRESALPICEDIMAVDWVVAGDLDGPISPSPGSTMRLQFIKLKEGLGESEKAEVMGVIGGLKEKLGESGISITQLSCGENFSPGRAKGFSIASIGVFSGINELDAATGMAEIAAEKDKVRDYIDGLVVVDYVVPSAQSASL
ncbi:hypothetical protein Ancab_027546 [Ancistrocladus abbreviatus]